MLILGLRGEEDENRITPVPLAALRSGGADLLLNAVGLSGTAA